MTPPNVRTPGGNRASAKTNANNSTTLSNVGKAVATFQGHLALAGFAAHQLARGGFLASKWALTRNCLDVRALVGFSQYKGALP